MPATVELQDLRKNYGGAEIIKGVTLTVAAGEFVVFVGPSGCGKSTLLRMVAGLEEISAGELRFDGVVVNDLDPAQRKVGMVFQSYALYPHMTVEENIGFGLRLAKKPRAEVRERVDTALRVLQLTELRNCRPSQLSGGQRQRVAIGRAIVRELKVFLFDEPLSNLDASLRGQMRMEIARLHQELKNTVIYVTHDQVEAMTLADRIVVLEGGVIRQVGAPMELYERPANRFVAAFIGSPAMGFLDGVVSAAQEENLHVSLDGSPSTAALSLPGFRLASGTRVTLGVRPEHCRLCAPESGDVTGTVVMVERLGADSFAFVDVPAVAAPLAVRLIADDSGVTSGKRVGLRFIPGNCHLFDADGEALRSSGVKSPS